MHPEGAFPIKLLYHFPAEIGGKRYVNLGVQTARWVFRLRYPRSEIVIEPACGDAGSEWPRQQSRVRQQLRE